MTTDRENHLPEHLQDVRLRHGDHEPCEGVMNVMELTAAVAGEG